MKIRRKYLFYVLAFTSAIIAALVSTIDATIISLYIPDVWAFGLSCFVVGIFISLVIILVLSIPINKGRSLGSIVIDPSFNRIRLVRKEEIKYHLIAGFGNVCLTIGYFSLLFFMEGNPSVVLPFSQITILYLVAIESVVEKNIPTLSEVQSSLIVTFGAILGSISLTGTITPISMAIVFFIISPAWVLFSIYQRKLKMLKIDREILYSEDKDTVFQTNQIQKLPFYKMKMDSLQKDEVLQYYRSFNIFIINYISGDSFGCMSLLWKQRIFLEDRTLQDVWKRRV